MTGNLSIYRECFFINHSAHKMKLSIKDFFSKCDQIRPSYEAKS